ncbi:MAG: flavodoxin [Promethearchaeota archaeon]
MNAGEKKTLIAYYSRRGNNYVSGKIINLQIGNTEVIAKMINEIKGGEMFCIDTINPYPEDYEETTEVAKLEKRSNARPKLKNQVSDMNAYDIIFLGYPNWWGTMPMVVHTFLESYDFSGKTIIPFCTHEGSGLGKSVRDITKLCPKAEVVNAIAFHGGSVAKAKGEVEKWLKKL